MNNLKLVVNNKPQWDAMLEEFHERIAIAHIKLEQYDDPSEMFRLQGEIRALRSLTQLREKVNG
tara:strand:+ start:534 stop:725 length:192 start_codon:yes stop_codon:yes gene_type:complete